MAAIEAFMLHRRASPVGLPYTEAPRHYPVQGLGGRGLTERGVRTVVLIPGGAGRADGAGGSGAVPAEGPNGGSSVTGSMKVTASGGTGRSGAS